MSRKKRMFDIEMPDDTPAPEVPAETGGALRRRGPMASAIAENAGALSQRAEAEARIRAENDALAHEYVGLKRAGLISRMVPLDDIVTEALVRDRAPGPDDDLPELIASIREVGLSNPIRVEERDDGRYELIQGWRRLSAYRALRDSEEGDSWDAIPAGILPRGEGIAGLYRRMVDENLVRKNLSFAEMAAVAQAYADDPDTTPTHVDDAVSELFRSAAYNKRSYIRAFARLLGLIGPLLHFPNEMPRNLGLSVLKQIETDETAVDRLRERLAGMSARTASEEMEVLRSLVRVEPSFDQGAGQPETQANGPGAGQGGGAPGGSSRRPRTTFEVTHAGQRVKCTAGVGQLSLKIDRDLTAVERRKLEAGIARLLDALN